MPVQSIDQQISHALSKIGLKQVHSSNTRRVIRKFKQSPHNSDFFETIVEMPFLRTMLQLVAQEKTSMTKEQVRQLLIENSDRLKEVLKEPLEKNLLCRNCSIPIQRYGVYEERPNRVMKCPKCCSPNDLSECKEEADWTFPIVNVSMYIDKLVEKKILTSRVLAQCTRCMISETFERIPFEDIASLSAAKLQNYIKKFYCKKCGRLYDFSEVFSLSEFVDPLWNRNGLWLEWYVENLIRQHFGNCPVEQGLIVKNGETIEVDVLLLKNGKIISFECKAQSIKRNANFNDVSDVLKLLDYSDEVFLVSTTLLKKNSKQLLLKRGEGKLKVIEGSYIEEIHKYIGNLKFASQI